MNKFLMTLNEAATWSGIAVPDLVDAIRNRKLEAIQYNGHIYLARCAFDQYYHYLCTKPEFDVTTTDGRIVLYTEELRVYLGEMMSAKWVKSMHFAAWKYSLDNPESRTFLTNTLSQLIKYNQDHIKKAFVVNYPAREEAADLLSMWDIT